MVTFENSVGNQERGIGKSPESDSQKMFRIVNRVNKSNNFNKNIDFDPYASFHENNDDYSSKPNFSNSYDQRQNKKR